jgi:hypothetical protein
VSVLGCPNSVSGHAQNDASGLCCWCRRRVDPPIPPPNLRSWRTEADAEYRRHYDPDWGTDPRDD